MSGYDVAPQALTTFASDGAANAEELARQARDLTALSLGDGTFGLSYAAADLMSAYQQCVTSHAETLTGHADAVARDSQAAAAAAAQYRDADELSASRFSDLA